jgi:hypothetical protein
LAGQRGAGAQRVGGGVEASVEGVELAFDGLIGALHVNAQFHPRAQALEEAGQAVR